MLLSWFMPVIDIAGTSLEGWQVFRLSVVNGSRQLGAWSAPVQGILLLLAASLNVTAPALAWLGARRWRLLLACVLLGGVATMWLAVRVMIEPAAALRPGFFVWCCAGSLLLTFGWFLAPRGGRSEY